MLIKRLLLSKPIKIIISVILCILVITPCISMIIYHDLKNKYYDIYLQFSQVLNDNGNHSEQMNNILSHSRITGDYTFSMFLYEKEIHITLISLMIISLILTCLWGYFLMKNRK